MSKQMLSIITPTLNSAEYIQANIDSINNLTIPYEHIIVDGGSTDETLVIAQKYPKVKVLLQSGKKGMYQAIHEGFAAAQGSLITWVNSDDQIVVKGYEAMYHEIIETKSDFCYSHGMHNYVNENVFKKVTAKLFPKFLLRNKVMPFIQPCSMYTKSAYHEVGGLNFENYKICADLDLFIRLALPGKFKFLRVTELSCIFLKYGQSLGDKNTDLANAEKEQMHSGGSILSLFVAKVIFKLT
jgi:glycosyltransferase involved in cell wall biosynthesis